LIVQCSIFAVAVVFALASPRFSGYAVAMTKRTDKDVSGRGEGKPSPWVDTRVIYCGDNLVQLKRLPDACIDLIYIDPPFNSNRNYEVFWGETREKRAFEDRHPSTRPTRVHAAAMRRTRPRPQEDRLFLLPLRLARGPFLERHDVHGLERIP
jgi:hypothetical protein